MNQFTTLKKVLTSLLLSVSCLVAYAQQTVSGTVIDDAGEPLIGVSIQVKGTTTGSITDFDGNFTLDNVASSDVLVFSYVGYAPKEITVGNQKVLKVTLSEDTEVLDEVVVVGYGQMKKSDLTGSVSSVSSDAITSRGTTGVLEALQGSVAGVSITQSTGRVGGGFDVEIRGKSSTNSDTKPIYVVDGIICDDIDWLNPQDIERIDILKDASSTAIYGSRATAGVVQVSTKSGSSQGRKETKPSISYDGYVGWVNPVRMDNFMSPEEFYQYRFLKFMTYAGGVSTAQSGHPTYQMATYGQMALLTEENGGVSVLKQSMQEGNVTDWAKLVTNNAFQHNHYVAVNGSGEHVAYHFGAGYNSDEGISGDKQQRINLKASIDATINKYFKAGVNFNLSYMDNDYVNDRAVQYGFRMNPFMRPYDANGELNEKPGNYAAMGSYSAYQFSDQISPLLYIKNQTKQQESWRALGNIYLQIDPVKGLSIKSLFAPHFSTSRLGQFDDVLVDNETNIASTTATRSWQYAWDNTITYAETFNEKHSLNIMGLFSLTGGNVYAQKTQYTGVMDGTYWYNLGTGTYDASTANSYTNYYEHSMASFALRANYSYAGKYMVTATVRADGSSKFAKGHQWGWFPSAALAWRMSEESWMQEATWLTNLKWRLSYGVTGNNSGIGYYDTQQTVAGPVYYPFGSTYANGFYPNAIVDSDLSWETSYEWNAGLDFGFLRDRITGTIDYYHKTSKDLLYQVQLPLEAGGGTLTTNVGSVLNTGVEIGLKTVNVDLNGWRWETSFTLAHNHNEVLEINGTGEDMPSGDLTGGLFVGHSINNVYGYQWDGLVTDLDIVVPDNQIARDKGFTPGETVKSSDYYYACYGWVEGCPIIKDEDGDGKFTDADKKVYSSDPLITGSLTSTLTYKGFEFAFTLYGKYGNTVASEFYGEYLNYSDRGRQKLAVDYYIPAGTLIDCDGLNADGTYINPVYQETTHYGTYPFPNNGGSGAGLQSAGSYWVADDNSNAISKIVDASYLKVKNITLAYNFQKKELEKMHLQKLRLYCTLTNPLVATSFMGFDPEWASASLKNDSPSTLTVQLGLGIKF
ncbi:MAG: SusC/RagA family TonB-linked outer membrane protein [Paludibacteraceae bacterium]